MPNDTFDPIPVAAPASPGTVEIILRVRQKADGTNDYEGHYNFTPEDAAGNRLPQQHREGDLVPHLTSGQKTSLVGFLDAMLTKAAGAIG